METNFTRRQFAKLTGATAAALRIPRMFAQNALPSRQIDRGPFKPTWESLTANYKTPEWFRDAKFGMWAHWTAQCVPEQGDWYARRMYIQGEKDYDYHVKTYGHYRLPRRDAMFRGHGIRPGQAAMRIISDHLFPADLGAKQLAFWNQLGQFVLRICKFLYLLFSSNR